MDRALEALNRRGPDGSGTLDRSPTGASFSGTAGSRSWTLRPRRGAVRRAGRRSPRSSTTARSTTSGYSAGTSSPAAKSFVSESDGEVAHRLLRREGAGASLGSRDVRARALERGDADASPRPRPHRDQAALLRAAARGLRVRLGAEGDPAGCPGSRRASIPTRSRTSSLTATSRSTARSSPESGSFLRPTAWPTSRGRAHRASSRSGGSSARAGPRTIAEELRDRLGRGRGVAPGLRRSGRGVPLRRARLHDGRLAGGARAAPALPDVHRRLRRRRTSTTSATPESRREAFGTRPSRGDPRHRRPSVDARPRGRDLRRAALRLDRAGGRSSCRGSARRTVKVVLTGDGGDEIFGGYGWHETVMRYEAHAGERRRSSGRVLSAAHRAVVGPLSGIPAAARPAGSARLLAGRFRRPLLPRARLLHGRRAAARARPRARRPRLALPEVRPSGPAARAEAPLPGHPHVPARQQPDARGPLDDGRGARGPRAAARPPARRIRVLASARTHRAARARPRSRSARRSRRGFRSRSWRGPSPASRLRSSAGSAERERARSGLPDARDEATSRPTASSIRARRSPSRRVGTRSAATTSSGSS